METKKRKNQTAFTMYMPDVLHSELKQICEKQDTTMKRYILKSIITRLNMEKKQALKV
jgi:hypothetical protein